MPILTRPKIPPSLQVCSILGRLQRCKLITINLRLSRDTFDRLVHLLADNPIFISKGKRPQRHVKFQLACFLIRYGHRGSDSLSVATQLSIGEGTVFLYCKRVCRAIRQLRPRFLQWPDDEQKGMISDFIETWSGVWKCLGSCDGSYI